VKIPWRPTRISGRDALGTTLEFKPTGTFAPLADRIGGGPFHLKPGEWTDDTFMALCHAESLIQRNGFDAKDQMDRYCLWYERGHLSRDLLGGIAPSNSGRIQELTKK
jgi:ADP-ribosylglycohydrolase